MKTAIELFNGTTQGFTNAQKAVVLLVLALIFTGAMMVLVGLITQGAPRIFGY